MIEILTFNRINSMGLPVTFWVLESYGYFNFLRKEKIELRLNGYLSKKAYEENKSQMDAMYLIVEDEDFDTYFSNDTLKLAAQEGKTIYCQIYNYIQDKVPDLKDSTSACILNNCTKCLPNYKL